MNNAAIDELIRKHGDLIPHFYVMDMKKHDGRAVHEPEVILSPIPLPDAQAVGELFRKAQGYGHIDAVVSIIALDGAKDMQTLERASKYGLGYAFDSGINLRMIYANPDLIVDYINEIRCGDFS